MALEDPNAPPGIVEPDNPWDWVPDHWNDAVDSPELRARRLELGQAAGSQVAGGMPATAPSSAPAPLPPDDSAEKALGPMDLSQLGPDEVPPPPAHDAFAAFIQGLPVTGGAPEAAPPQAPPGQLTPPSDAPLSAPDTHPLASPEVAPFAEDDRDPLTNPDAEAGGRALANMSPEDRAVIEGKHQIAAQHLAAQRFAEESLRDRQRAEQNDRIYAESQAHAQAAAQQLAMDADELAKHPDDRSTGQKILGVIASIISGFAVGVQGGSNVGLDMIKRQIDQSVDARKFGLNLKRDAVGQMYAQSADQYRAAETQRVAAWGRTISQLQAEQQNYDPRGQAAKTIGDTIVGARQQQAQALQAYRTNEQKSYIDLAKVNTERMAQQETSRHNMATEAEAAAKLAAKGAGGGVAPALENPLLAGLAPKDRDRAVFSPDGTSVRLAITAAAAKDHNDEISGANAAISASDSVIAALTNDPTIMQKLKAKVGLNPQEFAVIKSKLSLLKPMIAKVAAGTGRIPMAELHAVDAAIDDPTNFTSETLAQIQAMRDATVDDLVEKFKPQYRGFLTRDSFGHAPKLAEEPTAASIVAPLLAKPVKGDAGYAKTDVGTVAGQLDQLFQKYAESPTIAGPTTPGGPEQAQRDYQTELDKIEHAQHTAVAQISTDLAKLVAKKNRTPAEERQRHAAAIELKARNEVLRTIPEYRAKSIAQAQAAAALKAGQAAPEYGETGTTVGPTGAQVHPDVLRAPGGATRGNL